MNEAIPLSQKLYLLGIHPEKGGLIPSAYSAMNYSLIGAILLELYLNQNIRFDQKKVFLLSEKTLDPIHRMIIEKIKSKGVPLKISRWLGRLNYSQKIIRKSVQQGLVDKRIIKMEPHQFLFFKWQKSKILNRQPVYQLLSDIEKAIFKGAENEEEIMLLSMLKPAGLMKRVFPDREKRSRAIEKLKIMKTENQVSVAVSEAIVAAQMVATSVAVTIATTNAAHR